MPGSWRPEDLQSPASDTSEASLFALVLIPLAHLDPPGSTACLRHHKVPPVPVPALSDSPSPTFPKGHLPNITKSPTDPTVDKTEHLVHVADVC